MKKSTEKERTNELKSLVFVSIISADNDEYTEKAKHYIEMLEQMYTCKGEAA